MAKHEIVAPDGRRRIVDDDDDHILADGEKLVVGMMARDSMSPVQRAVADAAQSGPTYDAEAGYRRKQDAWNQMCREMSDAWRTPPVADGRRRRTVARDPFGRELQTIEEEDSAPPTYDAAEGLKRKQEAYDEYCQSLRDGWKGDRA